ncbi:predicted protein [Pyrenophora tritici-repentis Pt-1C-BFP]|uniref:Uncharacterized protein n=1 Tax=Pyrenophora tritici-repentis (strain Pt-1C-BFP) TaxID=426418 RepID=B2W3T2_PYRTR|nr:uncharacterized protein PTRG_05132 [Pyrenophora tritici-repentis Pt-1C-BFP]EDU48039.1 predicted protein [Pyrenophora tritici-repentis Pt-1C-BFP]
MSLGGCWAGGMWVPEAASKRVRGLPVEADPSDSAVRRRVKAKGVQLHCDVGQDLD